MSYLDCTVVLWHTVYVMMVLLQCIDVVSSPRRIAAAMQQPLGILNKTNKWFCKAIKHDFGDSLFWPYRYYVMSWCIINYTLIIHFYGSYIDKKIPVDTGAVSIIYQGFFPFTVAKHFQRAKRHKSNTRTVCDWNGMQRWLVLLETSVLTQLFLEMAAVNKKNNKLPLFYYHLYY